MFGGGTDGQVRIRVNMDDQEARKSPNNIRRNFSAAFKAMAGIVGAFKMQQFIRACIDAAEQARVLNRTLRNTFRDNYDVARVRMNGIASTFGMVNGRLDKEFATFSRSWLQAGVDMETAMDLTEQQMKIAQNAAVGLGYSFDYTSERLKSFLMGNLQAAPRVIGTVTDANEIAAWALREHGVAMEDLGSQQQKIMRLKFLDYMQQLGNMAGYYRDGALDLTNVQANMNQEMFRFRALVGQPFLGPFVHMLNMGVNHLSGLNYAIEDAGSVMGGLRNHVIYLTREFLFHGESAEFLGRTFLGIPFGAIIAGFTGLLIVKTITGMVAAFKGLLVKMTGTKHLATAAIILYNKAMVAMNGILKANKIGLIVLAVVALIGVMVNLYRENERFRNFVQTAWNAIRNVITIAADGIRGVFNTLKEAFRELFTNGDPQPLIDAFSNLLPTIIGFIIGGIPKLLITGTRLIQGLSEGMEVSIPELVNKGLEIVLSFVDKMVSKLPYVLETGIEILTAVIDGIVETIPVIIDTIVYVIETLVSQIVEMLPELLDTGIQILTAIIDGIVEILPMLIETGITLINRLIETFVEMLPQIIEMGIRLLTSLISGIVEMLPDLIDAGIRLIVSLLGAIRNNLPQIIEAGRTIVRSLVEGIINLLSRLLEMGRDAVGRVLSGIGERISELVERGAQFVRNLIDGITGAISGLAQAGRDAVEGFTRGIGERISTVGDRAKEIGSNLLGGVRRFLGINSPSREMAKLGLSTVRGMTQGLQDASSDVARPVEQMTTQMYRKANRGFNNLLRACRNMIREAVRTIRPLPSEVSGALANLPSNMASIGQSAMMGLNRGLLNGRGAVLNTARNTASMIANTMRQAMQINSPSRLMEREVGQWIPKGIAQGIERNYGDIEDALKFKLPRLKPELLTNVRASVNTLPSYTGSPTTSESHSHNYNRGVVENMEIHVRNDRDLRDLMHGLEQLDRRQAARLI